jgi:hypothetical protein
MVENVKLANAGTGNGSDDYQSKVNAFGDRVVAQTATGGDAKPTPEKPAENKPAAEKPSENKPAAEKPAENKPAAEKPGENKPAAEKAGDNKPKPPFVCEARTTGGMGYGHATNKGYLWDSQSVVKYAMYDCKDSQGKKFSVSGPGNPNGNSYVPYGVDEKDTYVPSMQSFVFMPEPPHKFTMNPARRDEYVPELWDAIDKGIEDCRTAGTCPLTNPSGSK